MKKGQTEGKTDVAGRVRGENRIAGCEAEAPDGRTGACRKKTNKKSHSKMEGKHWVI